MPLYQIQYFAAQYEPGLQNLAQGTAAGNVIRGANSNMGVLLDQRVSTEHGGAVVERPTNDAY